MRTIIDRPEIEFLDGRPHRKVSPKRTHALVQKALLRVLDDCARGHGRVGAQWRFNLGAVDGGETEFLPDVAYCALQRLRALTKDEREQPPFAPDVAAEVRSPDESPKYRNEKIAKYLACGSVLVLDVDPSARGITANAQNGVRTYKSSDRFEHPLAPWLRFEVAQIFAELDEPD